MTLVERQKHDDRVSRLRIMSASLIARQLCRRDLDPIYAITVDRIAVSITIRTSPRSSSLVIFIFPIFTTVYVAISTRLFNHHFSYSFYFFFVILFSNFLLCQSLFSFSSFPYHFISQFSRLRTSRLEGKRTHTPFPS